MKKYTQNYVRIWLVLLSVSVAFTMAVRSGNGKIRIHGVPINLTPQSTDQLYKINDSIAFVIWGRWRTISVVSYQKTSGLKAMAGDYDSAPGVQLLSEVYQKGDYLYSSSPEGITTIINLKTGETLGPLVQLAKDDRVIDASQPSQAENAEWYREHGYRVIDLSQLPEYRQRGLVFDEQYHLTPAKIVAGYERLDTFNENLFDLQVAFLLIYIIMALAGLPILFAHFKKTLPQLKGIGRRSRRKESDGMARKLSQKRLFTLAEQQYASIRNQEVFGCWHVVVEAIANEWLTPGSLDELIEALISGVGVGVQEYAMEVDYGDPKRVEVSFITDHYFCPRDEMLYELRRLAAHFSNESEPEPPPG